MDFQSQNPNFWLIIFGVGSCLVALLALAGLTTAVLLRQRTQRTQAIGDGLLQTNPLPSQPESALSSTGSRWLVVARGVGRPVMLKLDPGGITLGRSAENQMVLVDTQVSRFHARIVKSGDSWMIADLHSSNGTFVNEQKITIQNLALGDRIRLGENIELVFQA